MNGNGNGNMLPLLERIADKLEKLDSIDSRLEKVEHKLDAVIDEQARTNARLDDVVAEQAKTNRRLDNMLVFMGGHHADHEQRIAALEQEVFKKSG